MRLPALAFVIVLGLLCPFVTTFAIAGNDTDMSAPDVRTADEMISQVAETYKNCRTYRDSGVATILFIYPDGRTHTVKEPFTTAFVRPDRFRFEYQKYSNADKPNRYIIWRQGQDVRTWWDVDPGVHNITSLGLAVGGAFGVSARSSGEIPALLLPKEVSGSNLRYLHAPTRLKDAKLGKVNCFRIRGDEYNNDPITFWIDSKTLLIRRIDSGHDFGSFRTEETMTYDGPVINAQIPEEKLAFDPPTQDAAKANVR